jgi:DNA-binding NarL/FixJ family response regulator
MGAVYMRVLFIDSNNSRFDEMWMNSHPDICLAHAPTTKRAFDLLSSLEYDAVMLDYDMGGGNHVEHVARLMTKKLERGSTVIVHTVNPVGAQRLKSILEGYFKVRYIPFPDISYLTKQVFEI